MSFKKASKKFVLSDSSVNEYGFRLLTSGYQLADYQKNPIGYYMHDRNGGVVCKWDDLAIEDDQLVGTPVINLSNDRGQKTYDEVESGFLNAASVGHIVVLEYSNDDALKLPGQTGPTVTKWYNKECSLVDIPGNSNALIQLYDDQENIINLADFSKKPTFPMKQIAINPAQIAQLGLSGEPDSNAVNAAIEALSLKASNAEALRDEIKNLKSDKTNLQVKIDTLEGEKVNAECKVMLDAALKAGTITQEQHTNLSEDYAGKPERLKVTLAAMRPTPRLAKEITAATAPEGADAEEYADLAAKNWDDLHKADLLATVKEKYPDLYAAKYKKRWGKDLQA